MKSTGREPSRFTPHALRRGGASWAFSCGLPELAIKLMGDWASSAYKNYIDLTIDTRIAHMLDFIEYIDY